MAMTDNLSGGLGEFINRKLQRMQLADQIRALHQNQRSNTMNDMMNQGMQGHALSQSLSLEDLLQGGQQSAVSRSVGKTPINFPSFGQSINHPAVQGGPPMQAPMEQDILPNIEKSAGQKTEEAKAKNAKQARIDNETFPYYEKIKNQVSQAAEIDARLDAMDELLDTGNVQSNVMLEALDSFKDVPILGKFASVIEKAALTHETQVFKKLSTDFLRDAKPYFGSNMSTAEVSLFLERVPSLMQSNEGKRAVIRNFRAMNDYTKAVDDALEEVIAENGGERPRHIQSKVSASPRVKKAGEDLRKAFKDSVKMIPRSQVGKDTSSFDSLPSAKDYNGKTFTDTKTGTKFKSSGSKWVKV